jgi:hypothetical protein
MKNLFLFSLLSIFVLSLNAQKGKTMVLLKVLLPIPLQLKVNLMLIQKHSYQLK